MKEILFGILDAVFSSILWLVSSSLGIVVLVMACITLLILHYIIKERCGVCRRRKWKSRMSVKRVKSDPRLRCCMTCEKVIGPEVMRIVQGLEHARRSNRYGGFSPAPDRPVFKAPPLSGSGKEENSSIPMVIVPSRKPVMPDVQVGSPDFAIRR